MLLYRNPTPEQLKTLMASSEHNAAKWIKSGRSQFFWRPEDATHADVADMIGIHDYEKGLAVPTL